MKTSSFLGPGMQLCLCLSALVRSFTFGFESHLCAFKSHVCWCLAFLRAWVSIFYIVTCVQLISWFKKSSFSFILSGIYLGFILAVWLLLLWRILFVSRSKTQLRSPCSFIFVVTSSVQVPFFRCVYSRPVYILWSCSTINAVLSLLLFSFFFCYYSIFVSMLIPFF